ncbi:YuzD family protein [Aquibacillus sp. 3ASR75-11]|uniref:YuzD family protein n=1 Tax=Terrihalobacillus insolitus TaxID=2950438 RepID=A0A9X3WT41_9BACI|nr:YuzD family protein [Terrihalobacillus insolitus]MDC3412368.1 YuzD family protein [Terrihalobacillus insolitus]MDC3422939.1 YuzD family protein [Terrihalobacillus insolitus]
MNGQNVKVTVYGADQICASCVGAPGSKDTYEWLQAAIGRKYGNDAIKYEYVDIFNPPADEVKQHFSKRVLNEDLFYPVVLVNDTIVAEGNPRLKKIYEALEQNGVK